MAIDKTTGRTRTRPRPTLQQLDTSTDKSVAMSIYESNKERIARGEQPVQLTPYQISLLGASQEDINPSIKQTKTSKSDLTYGEVEFSDKGRKTKETEEYKEKKKQ